MMMMMHHPNNLPPGFFVNENVSMILTLLKLPRTREKPLEIFPGELFDKNVFLGEAVCRTNWVFFYQFLPTHPLIPVMYVS
jgi:hypothetical protein